MRDVTVSLDDETASWVRTEAARRDTSLSRFVGDILREQMTRPDDFERARQSYLSRASVPLGAPGRPYPTRGELYQR